ncbi:MAG: hypothetical protein LBG88_02860 [Christensenellaceae bacterium]|jgi:hypothetical protein|nr:hypothetical protein [Christensenellaceae bacterium]
MKKVALGIIVVIALVGLALSGAMPNPKVLPVGALSVGTGDRELEFENNGFTSLHQNGGVYIVRDIGALDGDAPTELEVFIGKTSFKPDITAVAPEGLGYNFFDFQSVRDFGDKWYTAKEYAEQIRGTSSVGVDTWFEVNRNITPVFVMNGIPVYSAFCEWELRINAPAARYGVRARTMKTEDGGMTFDYEKDEDDNFIDFYFTILYGDTFQFINCFDDVGDNVHTVKQQGRNVRINVTANSGAMQMGNMLEIKSDPDDDYVAGLIGQTRLDVYWDEMLDVKVTVTRNSRVINTIKPVWRESGLDIKLPNNLAPGQYLITITHNENPDIMGTYVIDNGTVIPVNTTKQSGIALLVIGLAGFLVGFVMILGPQIAYFINKQRYKSIDDKVYERDAKSIRKAERQRKEAKEIMKTIGVTEIQHIDTGKSFSDRLGEYRNKREAAKKLGISVEDYTEMERKQGKKEDIAKFGMSEARKVMGAGVKITESTDNKQSLEIRDDNPEFNIVESVKMENLTSTDQFATVKEEVREEATKPIEATEKGILGRIKRYLDDDKKD